MRTNGLAGLAFLVYLFVFLKSSFLENYGLMWFFLSLDGLAFCKFSYYFKKLTAHIFLYTHFISFLLSFLCEDDYNN